jgi:hypothetical protein
MEMKVFPHYTRLRNDSFTGLVVLNCFFSSSVKGGLWGCGWGQRLYIHNILCDFRLLSANGFPP